MVIAQERLDLVEPIGSGQVLRQMLEEIAIIRPARPPGRGDGTIESPGGAGE